jgi:hypothetical protein
MKSFAQQEKLYYKKGLEVVLDSLIEESPNVKFFLTNQYPILSRSKNPFGSVNCNINFDDLKQKSADSTKIIIPSKYRNRHKKNNFFNRLIYGKKLVELHIAILYQNSNSILFRANIYGNEGGTFMFVKFKNNSLDVNEFCREYSIY